MPSLSHLEPIDYLLIGHLSRDLTPEGDRLGGTVAYAALMAFALGLRVGIVTSWGNEFPLEPYLGSLPIIKAPTERSTTFENIDRPNGRVQILHHVASPLNLHLIPESWLNPPIVHLGPIAQEVDPGLLRHFPAAMVGVTPQGWLREWDENGKVSLAEWPEANFVLEKAGVTIISAEDIQGDEERIDEMVTASQVLVVTEGDRGGRVYWNGDVRRFHAPAVNAIDLVGAGDIFATCFFFRYYNTRDPWESARFATELASLSVTRSGIESIPTTEEIKSATIEVL
jgi:sugar/nucleoside kinase (ribokinase family)